MTEIHLTDAFVGAWSINTNTGTGFTVANNFQVAVAQVVLSLRWYRPATGASYKPQSVRLWDSVSGTIVADQPTVVDSGVVGWQEHTLGTPVTLVAGRKYRIAGYWGPADSQAFVARATMPAPSYPLAFSSNSRSFIASTSAQPTSEDNVNVYALDVGVDYTAPPPPPEEPISYGQAQLLIKSWLLDTSTDQPHSAPIQTLAKVDDATTGLSAIKTAVNNVATNVTTVVTRTASLVGGTIQTSLTATQTALQTGLDALQTGLDAVGTGVTAIYGTVQFGLSFWSQGPGGMAHATDPGWTEVDSGAFEGSFFVDARCDRVYVHITTIGEDRVTNEVEGFQFLTAPWPWYAIFANMVGAYQTVMAREAVLYVPGVRMDGVLVKLPPDYEGTWTASMYTG